MKPISNFRDHPALKYNEQKAVFIMSCSSIPELFLYTDAKKWCSYFGSNTFEDGETVTKWVYCSDVL